MTLEMRDCSFRYRRLWGTSRPVLDGFDYSLPAGLTVLLGPNGAGKSTVLRLAASVTTPRSGSVSCDGVSSSAGSAYRSAVAWMPQTITAMSGHTAREQVAYTGWLKGMNRTEAWQRAARALAKVNLADRADTRVRTLSGGQLRRVGLASALVHDARVVLLDEPTAGLDPRQRRAFRDLLREVASERRVLMSTHDVADLAEEADHVSVLDRGRLTFDGPTTDFLARAPEGTATGRAAEAAYAALSEDDDGLR
jgi:ABC-type multidrug transport system ATPase subunit